MTDKIMNLKNMLSGKSQQEQHVLIANTLERFIREMLDTADNVKVPHTASFHSLGLDSIMAVTFKTMIKDSLGGEIEIESTDIFNHPNINELAGFVEDKLGVSNIKTESPTDQMKHEDKMEQISVDDLAKRLQAKINRS